VAVLSRPTSQVPKPSASKYTGNSTAT
jgi:hypothetical protein